MESNELDQASQARREFLLAGTSAGVLGAIAVLIRRSTAVDEAMAAPAPIDSATGSGYRETEHIRKYYHCARYW
jgi:hypothetical protein